jgi:hypothetical protein
LCCGLIGAFSHDHSVVLAAPSASTSTVAF